MSRKLSETKSGQTVTLIVFYFCLSWSMSGILLNRGTATAACMEGNTSVTGLGWLCYSVAGRSVDTLCLTSNFKSKCSVKDLVPFGVGVYTRDCRSCSRADLRWDGMILKKIGCLGLCEIHMWNFLLKVRICKIC